MKKHIYVLLIAVSVSICLLAFIYGCGSAASGGGGGGGGGASLTPWIYVGSDYDSTITYINGATNTVAGSIELGSYQPYHMAVSKDRKKLYVTTDSTDLLVIDTSTNQITSIITLETNALSYGMQLSESGDILYITRYYDSGLERVYLNGGNTHEAVTPLGTPSVTILKSIVISDESHIAYVATDSGNVTTVELSSSGWGNHSTKTWVSGASPYDLTMHKGCLVVPLHKLSSPSPCLFVSPTNFSTFEYSISTTETGLSGITAIPGKDKLYVSVGVTPGKLKIIDWSGTTPTFEAIVVTGGVYVFDNPGLMAATADGKYVYVLSIGASATRVCVVDTITDTVVASIPVGQVAGSNLVIVYK